MQNKDFVLGIDTSNYTTSLALTDLNGNIIIDSRKLLTVKQGERGLRQSHALFQHMENLPEMILDLYDREDKNQIAAIAVSSRPRPIEGSYMPVFKAGVNYGKIMAASLGVPFFEFSHQEGHLEAVKHKRSLSEETEFIAYHLSGGTCELLHVKEDTFHILGGSRDLSFGQVIDRIGVSLGMEFPAGRRMDQIAIDTKVKLHGPEIQNNNLKTKNNRKTDQILKKIPMDGLEINLSGLETQCQRELEKGAEPEKLIYELFLKISNCLCQLTEKAISQTGCSKILFTGGVSASQFIRKEIEQYFSGKLIQIEFGDPALSSDNAVGISFLGGNRLWPSNR